MANERIQLTDTAMDAIMKLSDGNPGALRVCSQLYTEGKRIDPDAFGGGLSCLLSLDTHNIYGGDIWMLYKDVCRENLVHTVAVLRGTQLGLLSEKALKAAIQNRGAGIDPAQMFEAVCRELPNFEKANILEAVQVSNAAA